MKWVLRTTEITLVFLVLSACPAGAQLKSKPASADTSAKGRIVLIDPGLSLGRPTFLFPPSLGPGPLVPYRDLMTPGLASPAWVPFTQGLAAPRTDLMLPLQLQMASQRKWNTFYMVLGAMGAGAAGYMAYEHIKKYGLK